MSLKVKFVMVAAVALAACSKKENKAVDGDSVSYAVKIELATSAQVPAEVKSLVDKINNKQAVSFRKITELLIEKHGPGLEAGVKALAPSSAPANGRILKVGYEQKLKQKLGRDLIYNRDAVNIRNVIEDGKMQCYSGTYLYQTLRRQGGRDAFRAGKEVVIFEPGHVLPGYFRPIKGGFALVGIETTQSGGAGRVLTRVNQTFKSIGQRRVIDAEVWALVELVQNGLTNGAEVVKWAENYTAKKYGFELAPTANAVAGARTQSDQTQKLLNQSLFGFGHADVPAGDQPRVASDDTGAKMLVGEQLEEEVIMIKRRPDEPVMIQEVLHNPAQFRYIFDAKTRNIVFVNQYSEFARQGLPQEFRAEIFRRKSPYEICRYNGEVMECPGLKGYVVAFIDKDGRLRIRPQHSETEIQLNGFSVNKPRFDF